MRTTFIAGFILCSVTLQGKNCECGRFGFASRLGRDYRPFALKKGMQCSFSLGDFPRPLTQQDIRHCLITKNPRPFQLDSCCECLSIKAVSLQESQGQDPPESRQQESFTSLLKSSGKNHDDKAHQES